jgi:hypothetical protein
MHAHYFSIRVALCPRKYAYILKPYQISHIFRPILHSEENIHSVDHGLFGYEPV